MIFKSYIDEIRKTSDVPISEDLIEKDLMLSTFLSNWKKLPTPYLDALVFKGGTLLTKNYLSYHRISEDLDFIHKDCNKIRLIKTKGKQETQIKNRIKGILKEIEAIAKESGLEFEADRTNTKYVILRNSRKLYIIYVYYKSKITKLEDTIKLEIAFTENVLNDWREEEIKNMFDIKIKNKELFKQLTNYDLKNSTLKIYPLEEIILEKIRAIITREQFKPRDAFDLYLISKQKNIFEIKTEDIHKKLDATPFQREVVLKNITTFLQENIDFEIEEVTNLSLITFNEKEYEIFFDILIKFCKKIGAEYLKNLQ